MRVDSWCRCDGRGQPPPTALAPGDRPQPLEPAGILLRHNTIGVAVVMPLWDSGLMDFSFTHPEVEMLSEIEHAQWFGEVVRMIGAAVKKERRWLNENPPIVAWFRED